MSKRDPDIFCEEKWSGAISAKIPQWGWAIDEQRPNSVEKRIRKFDHESWKRNTDDADDKDFSGGMGSGSDLRWSDPMQNPAFDLCPSVKSLWKIF
jgi:hypothetical protein